MSLITHATCDNSANSANTWPNLVLAEPDLAELARIASKGGDWRVWLHVAHRLLWLVGPAARNAELRSIDAYTTASAFLLERFERAGGGAC